jgi:hypothetical protein
MKHIHYTDRARFAVVGALGNQNMEAPISNKFTLQELLLLLLFLIITENTC